MGHNTKAITNHPRSTSKGKIAHLTGDTLPQSNVIRWHRVYINPHLHCRYCTWLLLGCIRWDLDVQEIIQKSQTWTVWGYCHCAKEKRVPSTNDWPDGFNFHWHVDLARVKSPCSPRSIFGSAAIGCQQKASAVSPARQNHSKQYIA